MGDVYFFLYHHQSIDNIATPIAAALGDLITLYILYFISGILYQSIGEWNEWIIVKWKSVFVKSSLSWLWSWLTNDQFTYLCLSYVFDDMMSDLIIKVFVLFLKSCFRPLSDSVSNSDYGQSIANTFTMANRCQLSSH